VRSYRRTGHALPCEDCRVDAERSARASETP